MHASAFSDLSAPGLVTTFAMWDALTDIDRLLHQDGLPDAAVRSGVRHILEDRLPPLSSPLDWPAGRLAPGSTPADAAGMISGILMWHSGPATLVLGQLAGAPIAIEVIRACHRELSCDEATRLLALPGTPAYEREGRMTAGGVLVARTRLVLIRARIPAGAWEAIQAGAPAGEVLEPYGMKRGRRKVCLSREDATVDSSADLLLGDLPIGQAEERVTREFAEHVASVD
jgi:hypothetical protein